MSQGNARIDFLREHAANLKTAIIRSAEGQLLWSRGWLQNRAAASNLLRRALAKAFQLRYSTPVIDDQELLVGKPCNRELTAAEQQELDFFNSQLAMAMPAIGGQGSHMAIDYEKLLHLGVVGIQQEITGYQAGLDLDDPDDLAKDQFYQACQVSLSALLEYAGHYADLAEEKASRCSDPGRHQELLDIARTCRRVPRLPAETFREALQSVHFVTFCLQGLYQLGRPDRYLWPYYQKDREAGLIRTEQAQELVDCLAILYNEFTPKGSAVGWMVGGRDAEGRDVCNELSRLFLESIGHTRLAYPGIGLCYTTDTPEEVLQLCCRLLSQGYSHPALFNDAVIIRGLRHYGVPPEEACLYVHSTCVEITPIASSGVWVASPYINVLQLLLDLMAEPSPAIEADFDQLLAAWRERLQDTVSREARRQNLLQMERFHHGGDPLVSCFIRDCLARGLDVDQGGARYNWIMPSFVGLANLADSLVAVRQLVYEQRQMSLQEFQQILAANYQGHEDLRQVILNRIPKYGNDLEQADAMVLQLTAWIRQAAEGRRTWRGGLLIPSLFCWVMHEKLGSETGASPDGRLCGFPLGDGSGPAQGREKYGPTASLLSSTKWEHEAFIGGIAINLKFSKRLFNQSSLAKMQALIRTFMARGGFELQINVVDRETLLKARAHPDDYRDLVVRVGGYSDYFVHLSPAMQDEMIMRSEHEL